MNTRILFFAALATQGCFSTVGSSQVETADINLRGVAAADADWTTVTVTLQREDEQLIDDRVDLSVMDRLVASFDGKTEIMTRGTGDLGELEYRATFAVTEAGATFDVALERQEGEEALGSTVSLPESPVITAPEAGDSIALNGGLTVSWEPLSGVDRVRVQLEGACIGDGTLSASTSSVNELSFSAAELVPEQPGDGGCAITLTVTSVVEGEVDPALHGASDLQGEQSRSIPLNGLR